MRRFFSCLLMAYACTGWSTTLELKQIEAPIKPFAFHKNGEYQGLFYSLGKELAEQLNKNHNFQIVSWERSKKYLTVGISDIEISPKYNISKDFRQIVSPSIGQMKIALYTRKDLVPTRNKMLVAVSKLAKDHFINVFDSEFVLATYDNFDHAIRLLATSKVDGIVISSLAFEFLLKDLKLNMNEYAEIWEVSLPIHISLSNKSKIPLKDIEIAAKTLRQERYLDKLVETCIPLYLEEKYCRGIALHK